MSSISIASTSAAAAPAATTTAHNPEALTNINLTTVDANDLDSVHTCPHCDRAFPSHIGLVVTCESIAQRLANQCLEHPHATDASASAALTASANSLNAWVFLVTCVPNRAEFNSASTHLAHLAYRPCLARPTRRCPAPAAQLPLTSLKQTLAALIYLVHIVPVHSPHTLAWEVTCEFVAQRLANECLEHPYALAASALTALTAPVHLLIAWTYKATWASTATLNYHILPHQQHTASSPTTSTQLPPPTQVGSVRLSSVSMWSICCMYAV
nr:unnamed protein product [Spirometra erinaceieuropaei]